MPVIVNEMEISPEPERRLPERPGDVEEPRVAAVADETAQRLALVLDKQQRRLRRLEAD